MLRLPHQVLRLRIHGVRKDDEGDVGIPVVFLRLHFFQAKLPCPRVQLRKVLRIQPLRGRHIDKFVGIVLRILRSLDEEILLIVHTEFRFRRKGLRRVFPVDRIISGISFAEFFKSSDEPLSPRQFHCFRLLLSRIFHYTSAFGGHTAFCINTLYG